MSWRDRWSSPPSRDVIVFLLSLQPPFENSLDDMRDKWMGGEREGGRGTEGEVEGGGERGSEGKETESCREACLGRRVHASMIPLLWGLQEHVGASAFSPCHSLRAVVTSDPAVDKYSWSVTNWNGGSPQQLLLLRSFSVLVILMPSVLMHLFSCVQLLFGQCLVPSSLSSTARSCVFCTEITCFVSELLQVVTRHAVHVSDRDRIRHGQ